MWDTSLNVLKSKRRKQLVPASPSVIFAADGSDHYHAERRTCSLSAGWRSSMVNRSLLGRIHVSMHPIDLTTDPLILRRNLIKSTRDGWNERYASDIQHIRQGEESVTQPEPRSRQKCFAGNGCCQPCSRTPPNLQSLKWNSPKWRGPTKHTNSTCDLMLKSNLKSCSMDSMLLTPYCLCEAWETSKNETQKTDHSQA